MPATSLPVVLSRMRNDVVVSVRRIHSFAELDSEGRMDWNVGPAVRRVGPHDDRGSVSTNTAVVKVLSNAAAIGVPAASRRPSTLTVYAVSPRRSAAGSNVIDSRIFREPNPFNPSGNRRPDDGPIYEVNLNSRFLPLPRLHAERGVVHVPSFTDLRLHDISDGADDPNIEAIDMHAPAGSPGFFAGNRRFITRKLWGAANEPPYFHHGQYTTLREAVLAHGGDAAWTRTRFNALSAGERDAVIEFLKSLQVLPPGTPTLVVDERGRPRM